MTKPKSLLALLLKELKDSEIVRTQRDFAEKLGYNEGYISSMMKSYDPLPVAFIEKLQTNFGFSKLFLQSNGKEGKMFARDGVYEKVDKPKNNVKNQEITDNTKKINEKDVVLGEQNDTSMNESSVWRTLQQLSDANRDLAESNKSLANSVAECLVMLKDRRRVDVHPKNVVT